MRLEEGVFTNVSWKKKSGLRRRLASVGRSQVLHAELWVSRWGRNFDNRLYHYWVVLEIPLESGDCTGKLDWRILRFEGWLSSLNSYILVLSKEIWPRLVDWEHNTGLLRSHVIVQSKIIDQRVQLGTRCRGKLSVARDSRTQTRRSDGGWVPKRAIRLVDAEKTEGGQKVGVCVLDALPKSTNELWELPEKC